MRTMPNWADVSLPETISERTAQRALRILRDVFGQAEGDQSVRAQLPFAQLADLVREIQDDIRHRRGRTIELVEDQGGEYTLPLHSLNVAILAMALAESCGLGVKQYDIGLGALVHDVGMCAVPKEIRAKASNLSKDEMAVVRRHPEFGLKMLDGNPMVSAFAKVIVLQHHERIDGSGYPRQSTDQDIYPFSRLIAICDVYAALVADRPYRPALMPHAAIEYVMSGAGVEFDHMMVEEFCKCVAPYPIGSVVRLNTGERGVVVDLDRGPLARPVVRIVSDQNGHELIQHFDVNLAAPMNKSTMIVEALRE
ncbi:MAG: HD-GYP domain-containing protein [Chloroflexota bacterium]